MGGKVRKNCGASGAAEWGQQTPEPAARWVLGTRPRMTVLVVAPEAHHRNFSVDSAIRDRITEMIQKRTTTVLSAQPFCS